MPNIKLTLSESGIEKAIKELREYRDKVKKADEKLVHNLTEQGVSLAQQNAAYMNIYDSGELVNGIDSRYEGKKGFVVSNAKHSAFCEFGTGVVGKNDPHPEPIPGWQYDVNEHGEAGWWYYNDAGEKRWTKGMPSRPYMYDTARMIRNKVEEAAKEVLK